MNSIRRFSAMLFSLCLTIVVQAQTHEVNVGLYGGASWWQVNGGVNNLPGGTCGLGFDYTARGALSAHTELGIKTGLAFAFASAMHRLTHYQEQYTNQDYYPENVDYTITADKFQQRQQQWQAIIPLFLSLKTHGVVVNIGVKAMGILAQTRQLDVTNAHIVVYYPDFEVPVQDYLATGRLPGYQNHQKGKSNMPKGSVLLAAEAGYEWNLPNRSHLGIVAYVDYSVWNTYSNNPPACRLIDVDPILNTEYPVPHIGVNYLTDTYANKARFLSVGVRLYYSIFAEPLKTSHRSGSCHCLNE